MSIASKRHLIYAVYSLQEVNNNDNTLCALSSADALLCI